MNRGTTLQENHRRSGNMNELDYGRCEMKRSRIADSLNVLFATLLISAMAAPVYAGSGAHEAWGEILGTAQPGTLIGASTNSDAAGLLLGEADVNLEDGVVRFEVKGLPVREGAAREAAPALGTIPAVKGIVVCHVSAGAQATLVETPAVPVDGQGTAKFVGRVFLPPACLQGADDMGFMVRAVQGEPPSADSWD